MQSRLVPQPSPPADSPELAAARIALSREAAAVSALVARIDDAFASAVEAISRCTGRTVVTGLGKSGHIGRKIAATLASTGTPALFVHSTEALHGDAGMLLPGDVLVAISNSGETSEVCDFARIARKRDVHVIAMVGRQQSTLARLATAVLDTGVPEEADPLNLAPTSSTTATLAMGDALAVALMVRRGFQPDDFFQHHPGGSLGAALRTTEEPRS